MVSTLRVEVLPVTIRDTGRDTAFIQMDFMPKVEGVQFHACDSIESQIGPGTQVGDPADTKLPAPPWWLLSLSAFALLALLSEIQKAIFQ